MWFTRFCIKLLEAIVMQEKSQANLETVPGTKGQGRIWPWLWEYKKVCTLLSVAFYILVFSFFIQS